MTDCNVNRKLPLNCRLAICFFLATAFFMNNAFAINKGVNIDSLKLSIEDTTIGCPDTTYANLKVHYTIMDKRARFKKEKFNLKYPKGMKPLTSAPARGGYQRIGSDTLTIDMSGKQKDSSYVAPLKFKIWCKDCCTTGVRGNASTTHHKNNKEANLFVEYKGKKSNAVSFKCHHVAHNYIAPEDTLGQMGDIIACYFNLGDTIKDVQDIVLKTAYDAAALDVQSAQFVDPEFNAYASFYTIDPDTFVLESHLPETETAPLVMGRIAEFTVQVLSIELTNIYFAEYELVSNSSISDSLGVPFEIDWDFGQLLVLPNDTLPPNVDFYYITSNPITITGLDGAIVDDYNYLSDSLDNYSYVAFYDSVTLQSISIPVSSSGGFTAEEIWFSPAEQVTFVACDMSGNDQTATTVLFSHLGYVTAGEDTTAEAATSINVEFGLLNWSFEEQTYLFSVGDDAGWLLTILNPEIALGPMEDSVVLINVEVPEEAPIGTENNIYLASVSLADPSITDSDQLMITVTEYIAFPYLPGDANMYNGVWQPAVLGADVTYLINYFRAMETSQPCPLDGFWASADANGDCSVIGSDATRLINYLRGVGEIEYCPDYPPAWETSGDLPAEAPAGWPNCE
jgi:hypothetical protein